MPLCLENVTEYSYFCHYPKLNWPVTVLAPPVPFVLLLRRLSGAVGHALSQLGAHARQDVAAVVDGVVQVVIAADGDEVGAQVNVVEDGVDEGPGLA